MRAPCAYAHVSQHACVVLRSQVSVFACAQVRAVHDPRTRTHAHAARVGRWFTSLHVSRGAGRLYREYNVVCILYGTSLTNKSALEISRQHAAAAKNFSPFVRQACHSAVH